MASSLLQFSRSTFRAGVDLLLLLKEAGEVALVLSDLEVQGVAYFGRVVAHAWHEYDTGCPWPMPYEFTYGAHGGPLSEDIARVSDQFAELSYIRSGPPAPRDDVRLLRLTEDGTRILGTMVDESHEPVNAARFLEQTCRAGATLSVPGLISAIQREPSLHNARVQQLRAGVPLGNRQREVVAFIKGLLEELDESDVFKSRPETLVLVLLDALQWQVEETGR
jgi:hypothetical protein